jgi:hypothetical protein
MSNFAKSKNQLWRESGTTLTFKDWLERESMKGTIPPKEHLLNVDGKDNLLDTTKLEDTLGINNTDKFEKILGIGKNPEDVNVNKNNFLGLNKWVLISSIILISGAIAYKVYTKKK